MIEVRALTKRYGDVVAVDELSFRVRPGVVTGFLGANGAGKSTTMRIILGLDHPTSGCALIGGRPYRELDQPLRHVGALIESDAVHPGRSARNHLRVAARSNGLPVARADEVLERVGLASVAGRRAKGLSLGMRQRLGIAAALLGDPAVLLFDEPVNGLDADGVRWVRALVRDLAAEGRTVLLSSHLLTEMQRTADRLVIIGRGRLLADATIGDVLARAGRTTRVRSSDRLALAAQLRRTGRTVDLLDDGALVVADVDAADIGEAARVVDVAIHELTDHSPSLEDVYMELTRNSMEFTAGSGAGAGAADGDGGTP